MTLLWRTDKTIQEEKISIGAIVSALYFISMPLSIVPLPGGISLLKAVSVLVGCVLIANLFLGHNKLQLNGVHFIFSLYILYSVSSWFILRDINAWENLRGLLQTGLIFYLITSKVFNRREQELFVNIWMLVGVITTYNILFSGAVVNTSERITISLGGGYEDPNQLCGYFLLPILYTMEKIRARKKDFVTILYVGFIFAMMYAVFTTGSRGGLIAVIITIVMYIFMEFKGIAGKLKMIGLGFAFVMIFYFVFFPILPESVTERMTIQSVQEDKGSGRFDLWKTIILSVTEDDIGFVFGYGIGATEKILLDAGHKNTVAHNHWLQVLADQGLIGLGIFVAVFSVGFFRCFKRQRVISIGLIGMMALSMSLTMYAAYKPFWNVLMMSALNLDVWGESKIELESQCSSDSI